jgi:hypothetical protein
MAALAPVVPFISAGATLLGGISANRDAQYQAAVGMKNAQLLEEQAQREHFAATVDAEDQDTSARAEIADMMAQFAASGLSSSSGSFVMRNLGASSLAKRDRTRLMQKRDVQLYNTRNQVSSMRNEANATRRGGRTGLLSTALAVPTSYLSGASMVNDYTRGRMSLSSPSYAGGR